MKQKFLETISDGKWFIVNSQYGGKYLVKMGKSKHYDNGIHSVWLSANDTESMSVSDYLENDWQMINGNTIQTYGAGVFQFGSGEIEEDSIYDEQGNVNVDKLVFEILNNTEKDFIDEVQIRDAWNKLKTNELSIYPTLEFK